MIIYPTETLYALGVNALDSSELRDLYELKERQRSQPASWLVRDIADIEKYATVTPQAQKIAERFLPGSLTLVLQAKEHIAAEFLAEDRTIGFRISTDPIAAQLIAEFMEEFHAPLTCTSANVSGSPTLPTPGEILQQFGAKASMIGKIYDDGPRKGLASTIVRVVDDTVTVLREGNISETEIKEVLHT